MKPHFLALFLLAAPSAFAIGAYVGATPLAVSNVAVSRDPATHVLRVSYDLSNENNEPAYITLDVQTNGVSIGWDKFRTLSGDVTRLADPLPVACGTGKDAASEPPDRSTRM